MKAMIFAAGEGRRMRPLTDTTPKPLLTVNNIPLIEHLLLRLREAGIKDIVINVAYLGEQIIARLGDGAALGLNIQYSLEPEPLETGGGIYHALHLLGEAPFLLVNADVWCDYPLRRLNSVDVKDAGAHLVLVPNPEHKKEGDFEFDRTGNVVAYGRGFTFSGISKVAPGLIAQYPNVRSHFPLLEALKWAIGAQKLTAELYNGLWVDVGTPERLEHVNQLAI